MMFLVSNRGLAEGKCPLAAKPYIVISIYSTNSSPARIPSHKDCLGILPICFDDVEEDMELFEKTRLISLRAITSKQAENIWQFVESFIGKAEIVCVHCDAGVSRSPAVAAALSKAMGKSDTKFFNSYRPNMKVYKEILKVKGLSNDYRKED